MKALPENAFVLALADLPRIGPATLTRLLAGRRPEEAWELVRSGEAALTDGVTSEDRAVRRAAEWARWASSHDPGPRWASCGPKGIGVTWADRPDFPIALAADRSPPGALFWVGDLGALRQPCVAVIGTRRATPYGRELSRRLGEDLAAAGVCVVSGLAQGIDGSAHVGALAASAAAAAGVAASGVDVPYPPQHAGLWREMASRGVIVSETPPGRPAQRWRFPTRNRIIAGLVKAVVVVESHAGGGSLITVEAALVRGVEVFAVPGPVGSPASAGTNQMLFDGAGMVRDADDILGALALAGVAPTSPGRSSKAASKQAAPPLQVSGPVREVLEAVDRQPTSLNQVVLRCSLAVSQVTVALDELERAGAVSCEAGWWTRLR